MLKVFAQLVLSLLAFGAVITHKSDEVVAIYITGSLLCVALRKAK